MNFRVSGSAVGVAMLWATRGFAHPGHGTSGTEGTAVHYVIEPIHAATWISAIAATLLVSVITLRYRGRRNRAASQA